MVDLSRNEKDAEIRLQEKIEKLDIPAPRCILKLAKHFFETGRYEEAEKYIDHCKRSARRLSKAQIPRVTKSWRYSALCWRN